MIGVQRTQNPKIRPDVNQLGFGRYFTDHMFLARYSQPKGGWYQTEVVPYAPLELDPCASVLHYGQALFEGMKAFRHHNGQIAILRPQFNWQRMKNGAQRLCMEAPPIELFMNGLEALLSVDHDWIPNQKGTSLYIRPTLIATEAFLGVRPSTEYLFFIILSPVGNYYGPTAQAVKIWIEKEYTRAAPGGLGATKAAANYAGSLKAAVQARERGFAQVLWLDVTKKYIEEVGTMNVFFVINKKIVTPQLTGTILEGGTRAMALEILRHKGYEVEERLIALDEIKEAHRLGHLSEAFGVGTAAVVTPIRELASYDFQMDFSSSQGQAEGPVSSYLFSEISSLQMGQSKNFPHWLHLLDVEKNKN